MKTRLPSTDSIDELAAFWDSHDVTEFADELEEVESPFGSRPPALVVPLTESERQEIRRIADSKGVSERELLHEWVAEKLHHP